MVLSLAWGVNDFQNSVIQPQEDGSTSEPKWSNWEVSSTVSCAVWQPIFKLLGHWHSKWAVNRFSKLVHRITGGWKQFMNWNATLGWACAHSVVLFGMWISLLLLGQVNNKFYSRMETLLDWNGTPWGHFRIYCIVWHPIVKTARSLALETGLQHTFHNF